MFHIEPDSIYKWQKWEMIDSKILTEFAISPCYEHENGCDTIRKILTWDKKNYSLVYRMTA